MSAQNVDRGRVKLVPRHPSGQCPVCTQSGPDIRYVSLGVPAFLMQAGVELPPSGGIYSVDTESEPGVEIHDVYDLVADAHRQQQIVRELIICEGCAAGAAEAIGYGDTIEIAVERDDAIAGRDQAVKDREALERRVVELEDACHAERMGRVAAEASLAASTRSNGHDADPPAKATRRGKAAA